MTSLEFIFVLLSVACLTTAKPAKYTSKFDNFDVDQVLKSDRLLNNYFNCLMDKGPCTVEGTELKKNLGEAIQTECSKCTESQRTKAQKAIEYLRKNKSDMWKALEDKYDPDHTYVSRLEKRKEIKS